MLAGDAELAGRDVVTLWPGILAKETRRETEREALLRTALEPTWKRELKHLRKPGQQPEPSLPPAEWFYPRNGTPCSPGSIRRLFFEIFRRELAVPRWELEVLLECTSAERKRRSEGGKLSVLDRRNFRKVGAVAG